MVKLNHKTMKLRMIHGGLTIARVDETEVGRTRGGPVIRGYSYLEDGRRVMQAQIPQMALTSPPYEQPSEFRLGGHLGN